VGWGWLGVVCAGRFGVGRSWLVLAGMELVGWGRSHRSRFRVLLPVGVCAIGFGVCAFELVGQCWVVMVCEVRWLRRWVVL